MLNKQNERVEADKLGRQENSQDIISLKRARSLGLDNGYLSIDIVLHLHSSFIPGKV